MTKYPNTVEHPGSPSPIPTCIWTPSPLSLCQITQQITQRHIAQRMSKPHRWIPLYCHLLGFRWLFIRWTWMRIQWEKYCWNITLCIQMDDKWKETVFGKVLSHYEQPGTTLIIFGKSVWHFWSDEQMSEYNISMPIQLGWDLMTMKTMAHDLHIWSFS